MASSAVSLIGVVCPRRNAPSAVLVARARTIPNLRIVALVPNLRYATMAFEAGTHVITIPVSVSEPHSIANIRKTHPEIIADVRAIVAFRDRSFSEVEATTELSTSADTLPLRVAAPISDYLQWLTAGASDYLQWLTADLSHCLQWLNAGASDYLQWLPADLSD